MDQLQYIKGLVALWVTRSNSLQIPPLKLQEIHNTTGKGPNWWLSLYRAPTVAECDSEMASIRNKLHGTARSDLRRTINRHVARREMLRELGKTRRVLKSILGNLGGRKHQDPLFLGAVRQSDTPVICTPAEVHNALNITF